MKINNSLSAVLLTAVAVTLFGSCNKNLPPDGFFNPLTGGCQVAEYHIPLFDQFFPTPPPYLFVKSFDATGKVVTGIDCSFTNDILPLTLPTFTLHINVVQQRWMVLLIRKPAGKKGVSPDILGRIYLNRAGRPDSCVCAPGIDPFEAAFPVTEHYYYKNDRLLAVNDIVYLGPRPPQVSTDTISYDRFGNPLSFIHNSYQYDYSRRSKQQFYCDDFMETDRVFYLLQYLGFFPEVTNPPNVRTAVTIVESDQPVALSSPHFDSEGKLISYGLSFGGLTTITWNCK
jgi:hypothetical protein